MAWAGFGAAFAVNAASFAVSALVVIRSRLPYPDTHQSQGTVTWVQQVREGLTLLLGDRRLRALAAGQLLAALSAGATSALLVVLAREHLGLDATGYGLMLAAIGVGAAAGPLLLSRLVRTARCSCSVPSCCARSSTSC